MVRTGALRLAPEAGSEADGSGHVCSVINELTVESGIERNGYAA